MSRTIVVALDFLPQSERALALALRGYPFGSKDVEVDILHVLAKNAPRQEEVGMTDAIGKLVAKIRSELGATTVVPYKISYRRGNVVTGIIKHVFASRPYALMLGGQS